MGRAILVGRGYLFAVPKHRQTLAILLIHRVFVAFEADPDQVVLQDRLGDRVHQDRQSAPLVARQPLFCLEGDRLRIFLIDVAVAVDRPG